MTENYDLTMERTYPAPPRAVYDAFAGGWSGVWDMLTPGEHETGSAG